MEKQVIVIHGGDVYRTHEEYLKALKNWKVDRSDFESFAHKSGWKESLQTDLGSGFQVFLFRMPNSFNARYAEWKIWFDKFIPFMDRKVVLIGSSLGGIFLTKYLSENEFPEKVRIRGVFLVAAPFKGNDSKDYLADFVLPKDLKRLEAYGEKLHFYQSKDDELVKFKELEEYQKRLPEAQTRIFTDRGHFFGKKLPEIVKDIRDIYKV
jgi:hypothetical protein